MELRDAERADLGGILAIFNEVVANSTAIYVHAPVDLANRQAWFDARQAAGYPVTVAVEDGEVIGFGSFGDWRAAPGYAWTVEHTVHVRAGSRRQGVGRAVLEDLIARARAMDKHVILGGIDAANAASLAMHQSLGFEPVAHFKEVGRKFDRWLDVVFVEKRLS
jgi:phosphinothricin acetyltransferase